MGFGLIICLPADLIAQSNDQPDIIIIGRQPLAGIVPDRSLDSLDVEAYAVGTVGELITELAAENGEVREDPAFLVNGLRVADLRDVSDLPVEAILTIDVMPLGSGLKVGAGSKQRVYNIRLRRKLDLSTARSAVKAATQGGWSSKRGDLTYTHIRAERRINLTAKVRDEDELLESERDILQPSGSLPVASRSRSLTPANRHIDFSLAASDQLTSALSGSLSSKLSFSQKHSLLGLNVSSANPSETLDQRNEALLASTDISLNGQLGRWQMGLFVNHAYRRAQTTTDRPNGSAIGPLEAVTYSTTQSLAGQLNAFGPVLALPAGPLALNFTTSISHDILRGRFGFTGASQRHSSGLTATMLSAEIEVPIANKSANILGFLGDLSGAAELSVWRSSDFGSFQNRTFSLFWKPASWASFNASIGRSGSAPPIASLGETLLETPNVRYFDPLRNETVDVTWITGGVSNLRQQSEENRRYAATIKPFQSLSLRITGEYVQTKSLNQSSELPLASLSIMQAFPDRFTRNDIGRLITVDARPVTFAWRNEQTIRTGFSLDLPLGSTGEQSAAVGDDEESVDTQAKPARLGNRPRALITASHSWLPKSELIITKGQPIINLLSRKALGLGGLGQPRHRIDASLSYVERGMGLRATAQMRSSSLVEAGGLAPNVLRFKSLNTFSLRGWIHGERLSPGSSWARGARLSLSVVNLANVRETVANEFGVTPLSYQPAYRDPIGRSLEIEFRKKF